MAARDRCNYLGTSCDMFSDIHASAYCKVHNVIFNNTCTYRPIGSQTFHISQVLLEVNKGGFTEIIHQGLSIECPSGISGLQTVVLFREMCKHRMAGCYNMLWIINICLPSSGQVVECTFHHSK